VSVDVSTLVISLVVVGGAIAVVVWLIAGDAPQPATDDDQTDRAADTEPPTEAADHIAEPELVDAEDRVAGGDAAEGLSAQLEAGGRIAEGGDAEGGAKVDEPERPEPPRPLETASAVADGLESVPHEDRTPARAAPSPPPRHRLRPVVVDGAAPRGSGSDQGVSLLRRARSGLTLIVIVAVVGLGVAAVVGGAAVMISRTLESAVK
jgi:hypothetical protein